MEYTILRYLLGLVLLATGVGKLLDIPGFIQVLRTYELGAEWALGGTAVVLVLTELRLAEQLLLGRSVRRTAGISIALHLVFIAVLVRTLALGISVPNCGCFGVFLPRELTWQSVVEDLVMLLVSVRLFMVAGRDR
jgi:uncharacterized membrane protein YphA (DoxX/SURF4 family)